MTNDENKEKKATRNRAYYQANKEKVAEQKRVYYQANKEKAAEQKRVYYQANKEKAAEQKRAYRKANKEKVADQNRVYYQANKEKVAEHQRAYRKANKEKVAEYQLAYCAANKEKVAARFRAYRKANPDKKRGHAARRRAWKKGAKPKHQTTWELGMVAEVFYIAKALAEWEGVLFHVDHIYPLSLGGLHAYHNLQPLVGADNCSKNNRQPTPEELEVIKTLKQMKLRVDAQGLPDRKRPKKDMQVVETVYQNLQIYNAARLNVHQVA